MKRRDFLIGSLALLATGPGILRAGINSPSSPIQLYHTHTGEGLQFDFAGSELDAATQHSVNHFLRDFRTEQVTEMDKALIYSLGQLKQQVGNPDGVFEIISAYRSPKTNNMLRSKSGGVAKKSFHLQGRAIDVRLRGTTTSKLRDAAIAMQIGGVGYYKRSDFIHLDTGRVRAWRG